jgi:hypothetical protein
MKKILCIALLSVAALFLSACSVPYAGALFGSQKTEPVVEMIAPPETKTVAVVLDITGSTDTAFPTNVRQALAQKTESLVPPKTTSKEDGVPAVDGYRIFVQLIDSNNSNVYTETLKSNMSFEITAVPGLARRPEIPAKGATDEYIQQYSDWKKAADEWSQRYDASLRQAETAAQQIARIDVVSKTNGNISGIMSAVVSALNAATGDNTALGVYSDLLENGETARLVAPENRRGKVVVVAPAPDGDLVAAKERINVLDRQLQEWGFDPAAVFNSNPESISDSINRLFE